MAYSSELGSGPPKEVYIPIRSPGDSDDQQVKVLLSSRDPRFTAFAAKLQKPVKAMTSGTARIIHNPQRAGAGGTLAESHEPAHPR